MIVPMTRRVLVLALAFALGAGCASTNVTTQGSTPYASPPTFEGDHPLVGRLVESANLTDLTRSIIEARRGFYLSLEGLIRGSSLRWLTTTRWLHGSRQGKM